VKLGLQQKRMRKLILSTPADINMCDCAVERWQSDSTLNTQTLQSLTRDKTVISSGTPQCDV